jgi:hypothetical protein
MQKKLLAAALVLVIIGSVFAAWFVMPPLADETPKTDSCYVGVSFCGNTTKEAELLIDRVKDCTNLLILQSGPVSKNETATNEICNYAVDAGLSIVVYFGDLDPRVLTAETSWRTTWIGSAKSRWGDKFLGVYYYEEPGGMWIDTDWRSYGFQSNEDLSYDEVANQFINSLSSDQGIKDLKNNGVPIFVSDYALHWFDFQAGYDVVLAQIGWNNSLAQDIALARGAANLQGKEWGAIITWKYQSPPYLDSGQEIYAQMAAAYEAGAKYIAIFDYPSLDGNPYGVLLDEHFEALEQFWTNTQVTHKLAFNSLTAKAALILPKNYGWGMRNSQDTIWGFWGPDEMSPQIWALSRHLLSEYQYALDIVYEEPTFSFVDMYESVYYWNATIPN